MRCYNQTNIIIRTKIEHCIHSSNANNRTWQKFMVIARIRIHDGFESSKMWTHTHTHRRIYPQPCILSLPIQTRAPNAKSWIKLWKRIKSGISRAPIAFDACIGSIPLCLYCVRCACVWVCFRFAKEGAKRSRWERIESHSDCVLLLQSNAICYVIDSNRR